MKDKGRGRVCFASNNGSEVEGMVFVNGNRMDSFPSIIVVVVEVCYKGDRVGGKEGF